MSLLPPLVIEQPQQIASQLSPAQALECSTVSPSLPTDASESANTAMTPPTSGTAQAIQPCAIVEERSPQVQLIDQGDTIDHEVRKIFKDACTSLDFV